MRGRMAVLVAAGTLAAFAGCGSDDGGSGSSSTSEKGTTTGAKKAPSLAASKDAKGTVTMCAGKDTSGSLTQSIKDFNKQYASQGLKVKLQELAADANEVRNQFIQREQAKSSECDVLQSDIIWTAEFAQQKWLLDITDYVKGRESEFIPSTLTSYHYDGKYWGVPQVTGAGLLYRRTDQAADVPSSWQDMMKVGAQHDGFAMQGAPYEGLTCDFIEVSSAAGGKILSDDGKKAEFDSPENLKALELLVNGVKSGGVVKASTTYMEEPARLEFEAGKATFMRNWSYAYALGKKSKNIGTKFAVSPLPPFEGGGQGGVLGGNGPVISSYTDNPKGSMLWLDYWTSKKVIDRGAATYSLPPTLKSSYDEPGVKKALPYSDQLLKAVENATTRPVSPVYSQISEAVYKNVNAAMSGSISPQDALKKGQSQIENALNAF
jgi:multiple sugar transport system substrate-binding protein